MAITQASLTSGQDIESFQPTSVTASISPTANRLVLLAVFTCCVTPSEAAPPTSVTGASMTWTPIGSVTDTAAGLDLTLFRALSASPGTGALTITHNAPGSVNTCHWSIMEFAGIDTGGTNGSAAVVQFASNKDVTATVATITATLGAFGSADHGAYSAHGWFNFAALPTATPDSGWTEIHEQGSVWGAGGYATAIESQWRVTNDTTALATWTGNGGVMAAAIELKAELAVAPVVPPSYRDFPKFLLRRAS